VRERNPTSILIETYRIETKMVGKKHCPHYPTEQHPQRGFCC
jgi:hypothetical protein